MTVTAADIAATIEAAPAWVLIGLTMPVQRIREEAVAEMGRHVHGALYGPPMADARQLTLPLA